MLHQSDAYLAWLLAPLLLAAALGVRLVVGAAVVSIILVCTVVGACRPFLSVGAARAP